MMIADSPYRPEPLTVPPERRTADAIRAVDRLIHTHLQQSPIDSRVLANLAVAMATEYSGAGHGLLLLDEGNGLTIQCAIGPGPQPESLEKATYSSELVDRLVASHRLQRDDDHLAAPILLAGKVQGVLYLEAGAAPLNADAEELATSVATRIATLLHSANLVEDVANRTRNVETLETLSACLSAGTLRDEHLQRAVEAALVATRSDQAFLGLFGKDHVGLDLHHAGADADTLSPLARELSAALQAGDRGRATALLGPTHLVEELSGQLLASPGGDTRRPLGFVAVRRQLERPYNPNETSFFRALANLLSGALARLSYFRHASEDTLTGTGSRLALDLAFEEALQRARASERPLSVLLIDVDLFKQINDRHGHLVGDEVLTGIAAVIRERLRAGDFVARYGGDEFLVLLPETAPDQAHAVADEIRRLVSLKRFGGRRLDVSLSMGLSTYPDAGDDSRSLLRAADQALYASKAGGRDQITTHGRKRPQLGP